MSDLTYGTQNIQRRVATDITKYQTTWIRGILGIMFNDFSLKNRLFDFIQQNASTITAPLSILNDNRQYVIDNPKNWATDEHFIK